MDVLLLLRLGWAEGASQEVLLLSIDLQKAFDSVFWAYMFQVMEFWGFGPLFLCILGTLYSHPQAKVKLMGYVPDKAVPCLY